MQLQAVKNQQQPGQFFQGSHSRQNLHFHDGKKLLFYFSIQFLIPWFFTWWVIISYESVGCTFFSSDFFC